MTTEATDTTPKILDGTGKPARRPETRLCPTCGADPERRTLSGGYGPDVHDVCQNCGHDFEERTL